MNENIEYKIRKDKIKYIAFAAAFGAILIGTIIISVGMGAMKISPLEVLDILISKMLKTESFAAENAAAVVWDIRLPRILCAVFGGMGLAVSGVIFQGILQNPLADPYTLGISTGASFAASLAIIININYGVYFPTSAAALIGAAAALFLVIAIAKRGNSFESSNLIIAGIIISSVLSSGVSFMKMLAGENVGAIVFWIMGSLSAKSWDDAALMCPVVSVCTVIAALFSKKLDIMALGDENAKSLGINADRLRLFYLLIGSLITAVCVCVCGVIGFVGLIVPHLLRFLLTSKNTVLMPMSALLGAVLLLLADSWARIFSAGEIPVGVITTLIGGPFFIFIFTRHGGNSNE